MLGLKLTDVSKLDYWFLSTYFIVILHIMNLAYPVRDVCHHLFREFLSSIPFAAKQLRQCYIIY